MSSKTEAFNRRQQRLETISGLTKNKQKDLEDRKKAIYAASATEGWGYMLEDLSKVLAHYDQTISDTSPFRIFKQLELRADKKAFSRIFTLLKTNELSALLMNIRDQAEA